MSLTKRFSILALATFGVNALPSLLPRQSAGKKIVLSNDDGWAEANVRATRNSLVKAGYDVILSCPAVDKSGTDSSTADPTPVTNGCEFNSCPPNSPAIGNNASDTRLNYVNAFPVDAVRFGIQTLAPKFFNSPPDFVVSGPNVGSNLGSTVQISGTVGAASEASKEGIPSVGFSAPAPPTAHVSYTTLDSDPNATADRAAVIYAGLNTKFTDAILAKPKPILPTNISINVNYPGIDGCATVDSFKFVLSRILAGNGTTDVETCGTDHLPTESDVVATSGCFVSVSVFSATNKSDVNTSTQKFVLDRLGSDFFSCLD